MQYGLPGSTDSMRLAFLRPVVLGRGEKLPHGWCCGGVSGKLGYAQALERQAKNALMLIESDGLVATGPPPAVKSRVSASSKTMMRRPSFWNTGLRITGSRLAFSQLSAVAREQLCASLQRFGTMKE